MKIFWALLSLTMSASVTTGQVAATDPQTATSSTPNWVVAQATSQQPAATAPGTSGTAKRRLTERQSFNVARFVNTCAAYRLFLQDHPDGEFASQARRWIDQRCKSRRAGEEPARPAAKQVESGNAVTSSPSALERATRPAKSKTVRQKPKRARKTPRKVQKKRVVRPKPTVKRVRRPRIKRCRMETNWECVRRGGQMEFGSCNRQRICE